MNPLAQLNAACRRLWRDESGVVLAFTVIVFLSLFVIACSVYGVGENIRQRIELQNAADAAAYSASVVQADALSRVAAISRAMAWTHVQMGRAVMDYDVDVWLDLTLKRWNIDYAQGVATLAGFNDPVDTYGRSWIGSRSGGSYQGSQSAGEIQINNNQRFSYARLNSFWMSANEHWPQLGTRIDTYRQSIKDMNQDEKDIIDNLQDNIRKVVSHVVQQDTGTPNAKDFLYSVICEDANKYFDTLSDEKRFLRYFNNPTDAISAFADGIDVWFKLQNGTGIQRRYEQQSSSLRADWTWHLEGWVFVPHRGPQQVFFPPNGSDTVRGSDGEAFHSSNYYETETVKPQYLKGDYFKPAGTIVVGVARRQDNPLSFMMADPGKPGLFGFFSPDAAGGNQSYSWAAAAARAGYRDGGTEGEYLTKDSGNWVSSEKNLSQWDWDGELIPLPWATDVQAMWNSSTWKSLGNTGAGGSSLGSSAGGSAPTGDFVH